MAGGPDPAVKVGRKLSPRTTVRRHWAEGGGGAVYGTSDMDWTLDRVVR